MLTQKQKKLLMFIHECLKERGIPPSFEEMKVALDLKSKSGIHRLITGLEERGFLKRIHNRARAMEVLRLPGDVDAHEKPLSSGVMRDSGRHYLSQAFIPRGGSGREVSLPMLGRIAAGNPILAHRVETDMIEVPQYMLGNGTYFVLIVDGESMINAGIMDGDYVIIQQSDTARNGQIVVALVDENVTLKRWRQHGQTVLLEPANTNFQTQIYNRDEVVIQGTLCGLLRSY